MSGKKISTGVKTSGFTLLEIVLVVALAVIMLAAVVPLASNMIPDVVLESQAKKIKAAIIFAQQRSVLSGVNHQIRFSPPGTFNVYKVSGAEPAIPVESNSLEDGIVFKTILLSGNTVEFNSIGEPLSGGGKIVLQNSRHDEVEISIANISGLVSISMDQGGG